MPGPPPTPPWVSWPRLPSESASSKKTITPPYRRAASQLAEEPFHLQDANAHEHVDEGAGVDENVRATGLARHRLGHQRLAGARRPPQQQATRHVAAALLHHFGVLEEDDVLLDPCQD